MNKRDWICSQCQNTLGWLVISCVYCDVYGYREYSFNPDITNRLEYELTPQEELFKDFFNNEKVLVKDMDMLTLRAHREELAKIAFEARARLSAVDDEEKGRKPKSSDKGFSRSVTTDDATSEVINTIKDRQKRLTKQEKLLAGLEKLGISTKDAEQMISAGAIKGRLDAIKSNTVQVGQTVTEALTEAKPLFNPFQKKD